jgi:hypothetical protein
MSISQNHASSLYKYIHRNENTEDEWKRLLKEHGLDDNSTPERG